MDRNQFVMVNTSLLCVALRKESVDRNWFSAVILASARRVALRKESVDRNYYADKDCDWVRGRSPQGERG